MADFSSPGVADLPRTTADTLARGDTRVLGWIKEAIEEGDRINRADPSYEQIEPGLRYVVGEQLSADRRKLKYLPQVVINESRKAMQAHVSALTDLKPLGGWKSATYKQQADLLNTYAIAEWVTTFADMELGECVKYALVAGTGDLSVDWDSHAPLGGRHEYLARDPRDTLPIRPGSGRSPQTWQGVILREEHSVNAMKGKFPTKAYLFAPSTDSAIARVMGRFRSVASRLLTPSDPLDQLSQAGVHTRRPKSGSIVQYRTYFRDHTVNQTDKRIVMGDPAAAWAYAVDPGKPLYPRGRLVVSTADDLILYDGPNTYWHGLFPVCRLRLWSVPWQFLGVPLLNDLLPVQDAINDTVQDLQLGIRQWLDPTVVYNRNAVSESTMRAQDNRRPGGKLKVTPSFGEPYQKLDGPNPQILTLGLEMWRELTQKHNDLSGTANLTALLQLRQLPSADAIGKYFEALTPEIRQEARQVEAFIRDLSEMQKSNFFQFVSQQKMETMLGAIGVTLKPFGTDKTMQLVPALTIGDPGYTPELDADLTTPDQRAQFFHKQFTFVAAPNSILGIESQEKKMMQLQLSRMGYVDFWTLHETLETPNVGSPPAIPLPPLEPVSPEIMQGLAAQASHDILQAATLGGGGLPAPRPFVAPDGKQFLLDPASGQILELRVPTTITERLQAQSMLGIGMTENPAGRKASGQEPPQSETKSDGRQTITESKK